MPPLTLMPLHVCRFVRPAPVHKQKRFHLHLNEYLYTEEESDTRTSGEKQFDYVNPRNREVQVEMEKAVTAHLKEVGAFMTPPDMRLQTSTSSSSHARHR